MLGLAGSTSTGNFALPASFPDLKFWMDSTSLKMSPITTIVDKSNNNNTGTVTGTITRSQLKFRNALLPGIFFDGVGADYITLASPVSLAGAFTLFVTIKMSNLAAQQILLGSASASYIGINADGTVFASADQSTFTTSTTNVNGGGIFTVAATRTAGGTTTVYVNAVSEDSSSDAGGSTADQISSDSGSFPLSGYIAEYILYTSARSQDELTMLHNYSRSRWFNNG